MGATMRACARWQSTTDSTSTSPLVSCPTRPVRVRARLRAWKAPGLFFGGWSVAHRRRGGLAHQPERGLRRVARAELGELSIAILAEHRNCLGQAEVGEWPRSARSAEERVAKCREVALARGARVYLGGRACSRRTPPALRTSAAAAGQMASCLASLTAAFSAESDCGPASSLAHSWETLRASTGSSGLPCGLPGRGLDM